MNKINPRPISPHLTIHKKFQTAVLSIMHRITGFGLSLGSALIVLWVLLIAMGEEYFDAAYYFCGTIYGKTILFLWSFGIIYHLINGLRYIIWSIGIGMEIKTIYWSGYLVVILSFCFTILFWIIALGVTQ